MKKDFDYKEWFMSLINVFGCMFFMLTIVYFILYFLFKIEASILFLGIYSFIYALFSAKSYMDVTVELKPIDKVKLENILNSGSLPIQDKENDRYILGVPFTDKLITKFLEVKLSKDKTVLSGSRKYVDYINKILEKNNIDGAV